MKVDLTRPEKNIALLSVEVDAERIAEVRQSVYRQMVTRYNIPGFRRGKAPLAILVRHVGAGFFEQEVMDELISAAYPEAVEQTGIEPMTAPEFNIDTWEAGEVLKFSARVTTKPEVVLGQYTGHEVPKETPVVSDAAVEAELDQVRQAFGQFAEVPDDEPLSLGSVAVIDFTGYIDGEPFEGGTSKAYPLELGSGAFVPGFEDQLLGAKPGEEREVNVTFPETMGAGLGGKDATFKVLVTAHRRRQLPELDDEFARRAAPLLGLKIDQGPAQKQPAGDEPAAESAGDEPSAPPAEVKTFGVAELRSEILRRLEISAQRRIQEDYEERVVAKVAAAAEMEVPDVMIERAVDSRHGEYAEMFQRNGADLEQYLAEREMTDADLRERLRPAALEGVRRELVIEAVGRQEGISVTDREVDERIITFAHARNQDPLALRTQLSGDNGEGLQQVRDELVRRKTIDFLVGAQIAVPLAQDQPAGDAAGTPDNVDMTKTDSGTMAADVNTNKESGEDDAPKSGA